MIQGVAFPISAGAMALTLLAGEPGQDGAAYFPRSMYETTMTCALWRRPSQRKLMDDFRADWYGGQLRAAGEAPIFGNRTPTLRFTWLRTFHAPVMVRLDTAADGAVRMTATELSGKGGYEPGGVARRIERPLTPEEGAALTRVVEAADLADLEPMECDPGFDGAQWIVESAGPGGYRLVERWSPEDGAVRDLGLHLLGLTGWTYDPIY